MADQAPHRHSSDSSHQQEPFNRPDPLTNPNVFSDDFALDHLPTPPNLSSPDWSSPDRDGLSPSSMSFTIPRRPLESDQPFSRTHDRLSTGRSSLEYGRASPVSSRDSRPLSQSFSRTLGTEFTWDLPKETSRPYRSISGISNFSMPRTQSPYQGATGPSHPYGMYPQDTGLAHSSSSATYSTMRMRERSYTGPSGPSQPYGMYPQNTVPEDEAGPAAGPVHPTPGFAGLEQPYRRRYGPDGEEAADLVGPDGYTEQLPPYTRYPNNVPPKNRVSGLRGPTDETTDQSQSTGSEPRTQTGGSQDTLNASPLGDGISRNIVIDDSLTQLNSPPTEGPEPPGEGGHLKEREKWTGSRRICFGRIPLWLVMGLLFIIAVLLGGVIGGVLGRVKGQSQNSERHEEHRIPIPYVYPANGFDLTNLSNSASETATSMPTTAPAPTAVTATTTATLIDAVPYTSDSPIPPNLPTGLFSVNLSSPPNISQTCLMDSESGPTWGCARGAVLDMNVFLNGEQPVASLTYNTHYRWGAQPPSFEGESDVMIMKDKDDLAKGPAYFFQKSFDKIVILRENELHPNTMKRSVNGAREEQDGRVLEERGDGAAADSGKVPMPTDKPWFCFWNGTILEVFLFVTQNSANTADAGAYESPVSSDVTESGDDSSIPAPPDAPSITSFVNMDTMTSGSAYPATTTAASNHKRQDTGPPSFPNVIKLEERRNTPNRRPYCQKMQIMNDGTPSPLTDSSGNPIMHWLNETETDFSNGPDNRRRSWIEIFGRMSKRGPSANDG
ncbi:hypothetical protein MMC29_005374, partial [Sticta canariensis]|nr:hypothetical protein [Sticta canariensis]